MSDMITTPLPPSTFLSALLPFFFILAILVSFLSYRSLINPGLTHTNTQPTTTTTTITNTNTDNDTNTNTDTDTDTQTQTHKNTKATSPCLRPLLLGKLRLISNQPLPRGFYDLPPRPQPQQGCNRVSDQEAETIAGKKRSGKSFSEGTEAIKQSVSTLVRMGSSLLPTVFTSRAGTADASGGGERNGGEKAHASVPLIDLPLPTTDSGSRTRGNDHDHEHLDITGTGTKSNNNSNTDNEVQGNQSWNQSSIDLSGLSGLVFIYSSGACLAVVGTIVYLSLLAKSGGDTGEGGAMIASAFSMSIVPFLVLGYTIDQMARSKTKTDTETDGRKTMSKLGFVLFQSKYRLLLILATSSTASILNGVSASYGSPYVAIGVIASSLVLTAILMLWQGFSLNSSSNSVFSFRAVRRKFGQGYGEEEGRIRLSMRGRNRAKDNNNRKPNHRKTLSFFSGGVLDGFTTKSKDGYEVAGVTSPLPTRPLSRRGQRLDEHDIRDGSSWLTSPNQTTVGLEGVSSFEYSNTTSHLLSPGQSNTVPNSKSNANSTSNSNSNSWLTSSQSNGATPSSFSYGSSDRSQDQGNFILSQPILKPIKAALSPRPGRCGEDITLISTVDEEGNLEEGPSIIRTSHPFELSVLYAGVSPKQSRSGSSPATGTGITMRTDSGYQQDGSFHSAQEHAGDQSFPRTVSMEIDGDGDVNIHSDVQPHEMAEELLEKPSPEVLSQHLIELPRQRGMSTESWKIGSRLGEPPSIPLPPLPPLHTSSVITRSQGTPRRSGSTLFHQYAQDTRLSTSPDHFSMQYGLRASLDTVAATAYPGTERANTPFSSSSVFCGYAQDKRSTDPLLTGGRAGIGSGQKINDPRRSASVLGMFEKSHIQEPGTKNNASLAVPMFVIFVQGWMSWGLCIPSMVFPASPDIRIFSIIFLLASILPVPCLFATYAYVHQDKMKPETLDRESVMTSRPTPVDITHSEPSGYEATEIVEKLPEVSPLHPTRRTRSTRWSALLKTKPSLTNFGYTYGQPLGEEEVQPDSISEFQHAQAPSYVMPARPFSMIGSSNRISVITTRPGSYMIDTETKPASSAPFLSVQPSIEVASMPYDSAQPYNDRPSPFASDKRLSFNNTHNQTQSPSAGKRRLSQLVEDSPGARSLRMAKVQTAVRVKLGGPAVFSFPGPLSQTGTILTPALPTQMSDATPTELSDAENCFQDATCNTHSDRPSMMFADALEDDAQDLAEESDRRISSETFGTPRVERRLSDVSFDTQQEHKEPVVSQRKSMDFGKWLPGRRSKQKEAEAVEMVVMSDQDLSHNPSHSMGTSTCSHTRTSCSTNRESLDLPPFRPSLDFVPVPPIPQRYVEGSLYAGRPSLDFVNPDAVQSTPRTTPITKMKYHKHDISLSHFSSPNFMTEMKGIIDEFGRTPKKKRIIVLSTPKNTSRTPKTPKKGILKKKGSGNSMNGGHSLPPIPVHLAVSPRKSLSTSASIISSETDSIGFPLSLRFSGIQQYLDEDQRLPVLEEVEEDARVENILLPPPTQRAGLRTSMGSMDLPTSIGPEDVSFEEDEEVVDEMENILTAMESPQTSYYMGDISNGGDSNIFTLSSITNSNNRPHTVHTGIGLSYQTQHNAVAALRRQNSKKSLKLAKATIGAKKSIETIATMHTIESSDSVAEGFTPCPSPAHPLGNRSSMVFFTKRRPASMYANMMSSSRSSPDPKKAGKGWSNCRTDEIIENYNENDNLSILPRVSTGVRGESHKLSDSPLKVAHPSLKQNSGLRSPVLVNQRNGSSIVAGQKSSTATTESTGAGGRKSTDVEVEKSSRGWSIYEDRVEDVSLAKPRQRSPKKIQRKENTNVLDDQKRRALLRAMR